MGREGGAGALRSLGSGQGAVIWWPSPAFGGSRNPGRGGGGRRTAEAAGGRRRAEAEEAGAAGRRGAGSRARGSAAAEADPSSREARPVRARHAVADRRRREYALGQGRWRRRGRRDVRVWWGRTCRRSRRQRSRGRRAFRCGFLDCRFRRVASCRFLAGLGRMAGPGSVRSLAAWLPAAESRVAAARRCGLAGPAAGCSGCPPAPTAASGRGASACRVMAGSPVLAPDFTRRPRTLVIWPGLVAQTASGDGGASGLRRRARPSPRAFGRGGDLGGGGAAAGAGGTGRQHLLDDLDGGLERQPLRLEECRRHAAAFADDRGQHDGAVDLRPPALARGRFGVGQDLRQFGIGARAHPLRQCRILLLADERGDLVAQPSEIHVARREHADGVVILSERQQEMLQGDGAMHRGSRIVGRPLERRRERLGPRNPACPERRRLRHPLARPARIGPLQPSQPIRAARIGSGRRRYPA